jgi:hypothetical protein
MSITGTDNSFFGRDSIGKKAYKKNAEAGEDSKPTDLGGSFALSLESTMGEFLKNKNSLDKMFSKTNSRKVKLFEEPDLMREDNIKENLD